MKISIGDLQLITQRGLLGNVFPNLRAVCVNPKDSLIQIYFYYDNIITSEEQVLCNHVISHVIADLSYLSEDGSPIEFETPINRIDYPKKMPLVGHWVFYRKEDSSRYID